MICSTGLKDFDFSNHELDVNRLQTIFRVTVMFSGTNECINCSIQQKLENHTNHFSHAVTNGLNFDAKLVQGKRIGPEREHSVYTYHHSMCRHPAHSRSRFCCVCARAFVRVWHTQTQTMPNGATTSKKFPQCNPKRDLCSSCWIAL